MCRRAGVLQEHPGRWITAGSLCAVSLVQDRAVQGRAQGHVRHGLVVFLALSVTITCIFNCMNPFQFVDDYTVVVFECVKIVAKQAGIRFLFKPLQRLITVRERLSRCLKL